MDFHDAQKQFQDNFNRFGSPDADPERYNLYAGLVNLTKGLIAIESRLNAIEQELRNR